MMVLAGLAITGMLFLPSLVSKTTQRRNTAEDAALARLEEGFRDYVRFYQIIPGTGTWNTAIGSIGGLNATQVNCVFPEFPTDTTVQRVFVVDDYLGGGSPLLPYTQSTNGLTGTLTNLLNSRARAMIVSSTKRGLALPVSSGFITQANFDAIWNWTYNPATEAPPSGWSSAWTGNGEFLHVKPLYLPNLFSKVTFQNTRYGLGLSNVLTTTVGSQTDYYFLNGAPLTLATTAGTIKQRHVVHNDASFDFGGSGTLPIIWFQMEEASGTYATNSGTLGAAASGTISSGTTAAQAGPRPSTYPNFPANNYCMGFNASTTYLSTTNQSLNNRAAFTLACWVNVNTLSSSRTGLIGQNDVIELGFISSTTVQIWTAGGSSVTISWPYAAATWHHITATGDGTTVSLYFDGIQVGSSSLATASYGSSAYSFHAGGAVVFDAPVSSSVFDGKMDEVIVYDRALSASEVATLALGIIP